MLITDNAAEKIEFRRVNSDPASYALIKRIKRQPSGEDTENYSVITLNERELILLYHGVGEAIRQGVNL